MNLKQELRRRNIPFLEFREAIEYTQQGIDKAVGTQDNPKMPKKILRMAFKTFLLERAGINVEKLI